MVQHLPGHKQEQDGLAFKFNIPKWGFFLGFQNNPLATSPKDRAGALSNQRLQQRASPCEVLSGIFHFEAGCNQNHPTGVPEFLIAPKFGVSSKIEAPTP